MNELRIYMSGEISSDGNDGPWMFQVKRGKSVEATGSADTWEVCRDMALEAARDVLESAAGKP